MRCDRNAEGRDTWRAVKRDLTLWAEDPLELLGLHCLRQERGSDWKASDAQIANFLDRYGYGPPGQQTHRADAADAAQLTRPTFAGPMGVVEYPDVVPALAKWSGCDAQPWSYTVSHSILRIKLSWPGEPACVVLFMKPCSRVLFEAHWNGFAASIVEYEGRHGRRFRITDSAHLDVDCGNVYLSRLLGSYSDIPRNPAIPP